MKPMVAIPMGDPSGIGPEIIVKTLLNDYVQENAKCIIIGDEKVLEDTLSFLNIKLKINCLNRPSEGRFELGILNLINLNNVNSNELKIGEIQGSSGVAAYEYIKVATTLCINNMADLLVTTSINKESLKSGGVPYIGHTEIIGALTQSKNPLTMFQVKNLRVFFLSRHVSLKEACALVTKDNLLNFTDSVINALKKLGIENPKIAVAGLNPHSGEHGLFGMEEMDAVIPAIEEAQRNGINIVGPIGADSVFHFGLKGDYDAVLSLYHDQGHIATKMVDFERTVSITSGLPILRTSVDHGTAFDIAGKGIASPVSLIEAIRVGLLYEPFFNNKMKKID